VKKYRFTLERVLRLRKHHELEWELKLAAAAGRCVALQNELKELASERGRTLSTRFALSGGSTDFLFRSELYLRRIAQTTDRKTRLLSQRERERDEVRDQYLIASRDRKVLDRLKERREEQHHREGLLEEISETDDLTGARGAQRPSTGAGA